MADATLYRTNASICGYCLDGEGQECHTPGCAFYLCATPRTDLGTLRSRFEPFGIEEPRRDIATWLDEWLPRLREAARERGYAIAVHGSLRRDVDLVAIPWTAEATSADDLAAAIRDASEGAFATTTDGRVQTDACNRPHGRRTWAIGTPKLWGSYIDLSVMPLRPAPTTGGTEPQDDVLVRIVDECAEELRASFGRECVVLDTTARRIEERLRGVAERLRFRALPSQPALTTGGAVVQAPLLAQVDDDGALPAHAPSASKAVPRWRAHHASIRQLPGPVS